MSEDLNQNGVIQRIDRWLARKGILIVGLVIIGLFVVFFAVGGIIHR